MSLPVSMMLLTQLRHVFTYSGAASYTAMFNVLNFTAGCLPVTSVTDEDLANMKDYETPDPWHSVAKKVGTRHCGLGKVKLTTRLGPTALPGLTS